MSWSDKILEILKEKLSYKKYFVAFAVNINDEWHEGVKWFSNIELAKKSYFQMKENLFNNIGKSEVVKNRSIRLAELDIPNDENTYNEINSISDFHDLESFIHTTFMCPNENKTFFSITDPNSWMV